MMNKILWHAVSLKAAVHASPESDAPVMRVIPMGTWLGVIKDQGDWVYVIGRECTGWVMKSELAICESRTLHINLGTSNVAYLADVKRVA
jgi:hypothetical protein